MKLQNLNELRYVIEMVRDHNIIDPRQRSISGPQYFVNHWPNPELGKLAKDQLSAIDIFDSLYYSPKLIDAKTYTNFIEARNTKNMLFSDTRAWEGNVIVISAKVFFKARLVG